MLRPLKLSFPVRLDTGTCSFGTVPFEKNDSDDSERLFAFAITEYSSPRVFDYATTRDGMEALSNLLRAEHVLAVVRGRRIRFEVASVVSVSMDGLTNQASATVTEG